MNIIGFDFLRLHGLMLKTEPLRLEVEHPKKFKAVARLKGKKQLEIDPPPYRTPGGRKKSI